MPLFSAVGLHSTRLQALFQAGLAEEERTPRWLALFLLVSPARPASLAGPKEKKLNVLWWLSTLFWQVLSDGKFISK
jgi:hypothetical protein